MTLTEILTQVKAQALSVADAEAQIQALIDAAYDRASFARAAMTGMLATGIRHPSTEVIAAKVYELADCMVATAKGVAPDVAATAATVRL